MSKSIYIRKDFIGSLYHIIEECGELCAAAGKTLRWGPMSVNPELPPAEQETNLVWLRRELKDVREAAERLEAAIEKEYD